MNTTAWKNPYIDKLQELPEYLIAAQSHAIESTQVQAIQSAMKKFSHCFVEFGSGSGAHLIAQAQARPDCLFIGFELRFKRAFRTAEKSAALLLDNILVVRSTATLAPEIFLKESVDGFYINFPDPWDKKKWKKHRLLSPAFIAAMHDLLAPGGSIFYKTDHAEYFTAVHEHFTKNERFSLAFCTQDLHASAFASNNIKTEFESLFLSQGLPIHALQATKQPV